VIETLYGIASHLYQIVRPVRDPIYRNFLRTFPCVGCATTRRVREVIHCGPHGLSQKASDWDALPGCRQCHQELHQIGPRKFQNRHHLDFAELAAMFQALYRIQYPPEPQPITPSNVEGVRPAMIDRDEDGRPVEAFFTELPPCESCGEPTQERTWNQEHQLWIGTDCSCNLPEQPICPRLRPLIESAQTVGELMDRCRKHRATCPLCGPIALPAVSQERKAA